MLDKFELFEKLPTDLKRKTAADLSTAAFTGLVKNPKEYKTLFEPIVHVRKFLQHVVRSEHNSVKAMLTKDINLFFSRGRVTDRSGRTFENISGFEYALRELNNHTWTTIVDSVPKGEGSNELRNKIFSLYVRKFLERVVRTEHDAVTIMVRNDMNLFLERGRVTDTSGRIFESISGFEYALWALDEHTWTTMLDNLPKGKASTELRHRVLAQYNQVQKDGVTYWLNGTKITEKHFDFEKTIIKELHTLVDLIKAPVGRDIVDNFVKAPEPKNWALIDKQWIEGVGGAQKLLPLHVVDEYCSYEPFYPVPKFTSKPTSSKKFYCWTTEKDENWFTCYSRLAVDYALYKGACPNTGAWQSCRAPWLDLAAIEALYKIRTKGILKLKKHLEEQMTVEHHQQVVPV